MEKPTRSVALVERATGMLYIAVPVGDDRDWVIEQLLRNRRKEQFIVVDIIDYIDLNIS
jgi:predicted nuclease of restriction endonuclease-like (RecB) superfamily